MLKIEQVSIDELIPYAGNARKHDDKNVSDIASSIAEYGFNDPIAINEKDNVIIEGHGRLLAAKKLGMKEVPVIKLGHMSEAQLKAYTLVHNRMAEKSEWDMDMLQMELGKLDEMDVSLDDLGFDAGALDSLGFDVDAIGDISEPEKEYDEEKQDDIPEVKGNAYGVKRGDIWLLGKHRLMCGDSTDRADVDRLMGGSKADMVFTSPPYNQNNNSFKPGLDVSNVPRKKLYNNFNDSFDQESFMQFLHDSLDGRSESVSIININYCANDRISFVRLAADGLRDQTLAETFCWKKSHSMPTPGTVQRIWEPVFIFSKGKLKTNQKRTELLQNHLELANNETSKHGHSASFPVLLPETFISMFDYKSTYDPFLGSGTTLIACEKTDRQCYGMEIDPHYCSIILKRYEEFTGKEAVKWQNEDRSLKAQ